MTTLVEHLSSDSIAGGTFALAFAIGAIVGAGVAAAVVVLTL